MRIDFVDDEQKRQRRKDETEARVEGGERMEIRKREFCTEIRITRTAGSSAEMRSQARGERRKEASRTGRR